MKMVTLLVYTIVIEMGNKKIDIVQHLKSEKEKNIIFSSAFQLERIRSLELWETVFMRHLQFLIQSLKLGFIPSLNILPLTVKL